MTGTASSSIIDIAGGWFGRPVVAVVDLDALATNVSTILSMLEPNVQLMAVVKANGYGHGAVPVAQAAIAAGASALGVATVDEGAQLRGAGIEVPILVFGAIGDHERARAIGLQLSLVVTKVPFAMALAADAKASLLKEPVSVHLKIDTGMRRYGAAEAEALDVVRAIASEKRLRLDGVMTHLAAADAIDPASAHEQVATFDRCVDCLRDAGITIPAQHVANSATTLRFPGYRRDMVRLGIAMYGLVPDASLPVPWPMKPVLTIHGRVARVFNLEAGDRVGYGRTYMSTGNERAALIPIGYADGYRRGLSNTGWMSIRDHRADVLGRVSMDQTVIRVPEGIDVRPGEPVVIVGDGTDVTAEAPTLDELASMIDTIGYEMATGLAARLPRLYVRGGEIVAVSDLAGYRTLV
jgi:alanine racemase